MLTMDWKEAIFLGSESDLARAKLAGEAPGLLKPLCFHAARLAPASKQALERLIPKFLQILLHAESSTLLFYRGKR